MKKKLSIITINYNNCIGLKKTIRSIHNQNCNDFEFIIIDGGSNDGSIDVIRENEKFIDYWISEKDTGIYNAMNKGIKKANGIYCLFLNSGDYLFSKDSIKYFYEDKSDSDIISGYLYYSDGNGNLVKKRIMHNNLSMAEIVNRSLPHASTFIKRDLLIKNPYDESLKICSDWKFFMEQLLIYNSTFRALPAIISVFELGGISSSNIELLSKERNIVLKSLFDFYPREQDFIMNTDLDFYYLSQDFKEYKGFKDIIIKLDYILLKIYKYIKG